jgi:iron complex transport system substrate-binding protein
VAHRLAALVSALALGAVANPAGAGPRVFSLDQCADQYVLALAPRADIAGLSFRARSFDSYLKAETAGLPQRRATLESVLAARPQVVVRYWGGDEPMMRRLQNRGVRTVTIDDAQDFQGVSANVQRVATALGRPEAGAALVARMQDELRAAVSAGRGERAYYLTSGGVTAGPDTLVGAMLSAAGLADAAPGTGFASVSLERLIADPPRAFVLGFFDPGSMRVQGWAMGRHRLLRRALEGHVLASLPPTILGCPAWFAADGARVLSQARRTP